MTRHLPAALAIVAALVVARVVHQARTHELCPEWGPGSCRRWPAEDDARDRREHCERMGAS